METKSFAHITQPGGSSWNFSQDNYRLYSTRSRHLPHFRYQTLPQQIIYTDTYTQTYNMAFETDVYNLVHGKGKFPQLHRVYKNRHKAGVRKLSRCTDKIEVKRTKTAKAAPVYARSDSREFQYNAKRNSFPFIGSSWNREEREAGMRTFLVECCPILSDRFIIYGVIGRGSKYFQTNSPFIRGRCLKI